VPAAATSPTATRPRAGRPAAASTPPRVPPEPVEDQLVDHDLERQVIGACLQRPDLLPQALEHVTADDFYETRAKDAWRTIRAHHTVHGDALDQVLVADQLGRKDHWTPTEAHGFLADSVLACAVAGNAVKYAVDLHTLAVQRRVRNLSRNLQTDLGNPQVALQLYAALAEYTGQQNGNGVHPSTTDARLELETVDEFLASASDHVPTLIRDVWPEASLGFIAGPPKSRKTWIALALALSVATGRPFLGRHAIPEARPVLYVALEGHRANLKQRWGSLLRGYGIDPDTDPIIRANWAWAWKPRGINLADPEWAELLRARAASINAAIVIVDVLRAAAQIKENDASDFARLRGNLVPILDEDRSVALLHHFRKTNDTTRDTAAAERMSGSGAMWGAADIGMYLAGGPRNPSSRVEIQARDLAETDPFAFYLAGDGHGPNGGYLYTDTCRLEVAEADDADHFPQGPKSGEARADELAADVAAWLQGEAVPVSGNTIRARFGIPRGRGWETVRTRLGDHQVAQLGRSPNVTYQHLDADR
jgi:hypothetical protein